MKRHERDAWMRKAPFVGKLLALMAELIPRYGGQAEVVASAEFRARMDAVAAATPGVAAWLADMPD